jgi:CBS domain-containing protein
LVIVLSTEEVAMRVDEVMTDAECVVHANDRVIDCAQVMRGHQSGFVVVLDAAEAVIGVVTDRDLAVRLAAADLPVTTPVSVIMSHERLLAVRPGTEVRALRDLMVTMRQFRAVVIDDQGRLVGLVSWSDVASAGLGLPVGSTLFSSPSGRTWSN